MFDFVDFSGEEILSHTILQTCLTEVNSCSEGSWVLSIEEERKACHVFDLLSVADLDLELLLRLVIVHDSDGLPGVLVVSEARRDSVGLFSTHFTVG